MHTQKQNNYFVATSFITVGVMLLGLAFVMNYLEPRDQAKAADGGSPTTTAGFSKNYTTSNGYALSYDTATDNSGNSFEVGVFANDVNFGGTILDSSDFNWQEGGYITKHDSSGNLQWARQVKALSNPQGFVFYFDGISAVSTDSAGNTYVTGEINDGNGVTYQFGDVNLVFPENYGGDSCAFVAKINSAGAWQWARSYCDDTFMAGTSEIDVDPTNGNIITYGYRYNYSGDNIAIALKYDTNGNLLDDAQFPSIVNDESKTDVDIEVNNGIMYLTSLKYTALFKINLSTNTIMETKTDFGGGITDLEPLSVYLENSGNIMVAGARTSNSNLVVLKLNSSLTPILTHTTVSTGFGGVGTAIIKPSVDNRYYVSAMLRNGYDFGPFAYTSSYASTEYVATPVVVKYDANLSPLWLDEVLHMPQDWQEVTGFDVYGDKLYLGGYYENSFVLQYTEPVSTSRLLDCRLPDIGNGNAITKVAPVIVPTYSSLSSDTLGLTIDSDRNLYTLNTPTRNLYGPTANTQDSLYTQNMSIRKITAGSGSTPGTVSNINIGGGFVGRPMDIDMPAMIGSGNDLYVVCLKKNPQQTP